MPGPLVWFWMKGNEDPTDFADAVNWECKADYAADDVQYGYCRNVPTGIGSDMTMNLVKDGSALRGAYPITFIDVDAVAIRRRGQG